MNQKINKILDTYEKFELAFLYKYQSKTYLPDTRKYIINYIKEKGLTELEINKLIKIKLLSKGEFGEGRCLRCGSNKIKTEDLTSMDIEFKSNWQVKLKEKLTQSKNLLDYKYCTVCGLIINNPFNEEINTPYRLIFFRFIIKSIKKLYGSRTFNAV